MSNKRIQSAGRVCGWVCAAGVAVALAGCAGSGAAAPKQAGPVSSGKAEVVGSYAFWPLFPDDPRIQYVRSISSSADLAPVKKDALAEIVFGKETNSAADIDKPYGVAMADGKIYVCDIRAASLVVFDLNKKQTRLVGITGANRLSHPVAVAVADDGTIYVADNQRGAIVVFDAQERYSRAIGFQGFKPAGVAVHGNTVYATDLEGQVVQVFDRESGSKTGTIGTVGDEDGQFRLPLGIATDAAGNVYVMDMMRCRLQKFSPDGKFLAATGHQGDIAGSFARPKHLAIDDDGIIYIVDAAFQNVQMLDDKFNVLMSFGAAGTFPGAMNLPAGIAVCNGETELFASLIHPGFDAQRVVVVTNQFGPSKVAIYAMGQLAPGYTAADLAKSATAVSAGVGSSEEALQFQQQGLMEAPEEDAPVGVEEPVPDNPGEER